MEHRLHREHRRCQEWEEYHQAGGSTRDENRRQTNQYKIYENAIKKATILYAKLKINLIICI